MKKTLAVIVLVVAAVAGRQIWKGRQPLPELELKDAQAQGVSLGAMMDGKDRAVFLFLLPGCSMSRATMDIAKKAYPEHGERVAFVGLLMTGDAGSAEAFRKQNELPFPVYALSTASDPFALREMLDRVGTFRGVYGGTVVLTNGRRRPLFLGRLEEVKALPDILKAHAS